MRKSKALIIIDMLNDFVDGKLANKERADRIIPVIKNLLSYARAQQDWVVVFSNDAHEPQDREISLWGEHAMRGSKGAQVVDALAPVPSSREWACPKQFYGAFDGTPLARQLREKDVGSIYLTGQHTNCCVRHSAYGAYQHDLDIFVVEDGVTAYGDFDDQEALDYLKMFYQAKIVKSSEVVVPAHSS